MSDDERPALTLVKPSGGPAQGRSLTPRQEGFCVDVASGMDPRDAFRRHYSWSGSERAMSVEVGKLQAHPRVAARIAELRDQYARKAIETARGMPEPGSVPKYGVREAMEDLQRTFAVAEAKENPAGMAKVVELRMRLYGLGISDAKNPADADAPTFEELSEALARIESIKKGAA